MRASNVLVAETVAVLAEDRADGLNVACLPRRHHPVKVLLRSVDVREPIHQVRMRRAEVARDLFVLPIVADVPEARNAVAALLEHGGEQVTLLLSDFVRRLVKPRSVCPRVERHDRKGAGGRTERDIRDLLRLRVKVGPHARLGEVNHDLVELAARAADVLILDLLRELNHLELVTQLRNPETVHFHHREEKVDRERCAARHAAARDVTEEDAVVALSTREICALQHVSCAKRESRPAVHRLRIERRWNLTGTHLNDALICHVNREEPRDVRTVRLICGAGARRSSVVFQ
jgi:hypothetical protein